MGEARASVDAELSWDAMQQANCLKTDGRSSEVNLCFQLPRSPLVLVWYALTPYARVKSLQVSRLKKPHVSNETQISLTDSRLHMLASYPLLPPLHECLYVRNLLVLYGDVNGS